MQEQAQVVVIGGGIMGCSTAYHLARLGVTDVLLLERSKLSSGTTWHSAAQVRRLRSSASLTKIADNSAKLYARLESETEQATGWSRSGSLSVATHPDRLVHIRRQAALAELFGLNVETVRPDAAADLWPLMRRDDIIGAVWSPDDGRVNPSDTVAALAKAARAMGVRICEDRPVTGFRRNRRRLCGVETPQGVIRCETAVVCAGIWSREIAALAGVPAPLAACEHFYLLTAPMDGVAGHLPTLSDHDGRLYIRDEVGGLLVGCFEADPKLLPLENLPPDFSFDLLNEDWDHFAPIMANAIHRIPALETAGARMLLNGPESFTPDGEFILGESPFFEGLHLGCGMNSVGMASGGGAGMALAEWIVAGEPTMDVGDFDARRFAPLHNTLSLLHARIPETLADHYAIAYPHRRPGTARGIRRSPLHNRLAALGAQWGQHAGWERAEWFGPGDGGKPRFGRPPWHGRMVSEYMAALDRAVVIDHSGFGKLLVQGPDAEAYLQRIAANDMALRPGGVAYTQFLNGRGGIESDLTVHRLDRDRFLLVTGSGREARDAAWLARHRRGEEATVTDVTSAWAVIGIAGPEAAKVLGLAAESDFAATAPARFRSSEIRISAIPVRVAGLSYTGQPGYELYVPAASATAVLDAVVRAGGMFDIRPLGTAALDALRIDAGFLAWGRDMTPATGPSEAGLERFVRTDKPFAFIGRDAFVEARGNPGATGEIVRITVDDPDADPIGGEVVRLGPRPVGLVTSAAFSPRHGRAVALAHLQPGHGGRIGPEGDGEFRIDIGGMHHPVGVARLRAGISRPT